MDLAAALTLGFFGSLHCFGMCGPLALALLPTNAAQPRLARIASASLCYNLGRVTTYSVLGLIFGLLGSVARLAGIQQFLSIATGVVILLWLVLPKAQRQRLNITRRVATFLTKMKLGLGRLLRSHGFAAPFGVGLLNGLLPCGFVYLAMAGALAQTTLSNSILFMALFGVGTMPAMLAITMPNGFLSPSLRFSIRRLLPVGTTVVALLLIVRGMALGVPYLSPKLTAAPSAQSAAPACHH
jgi:uncharacterized protein